MRTTGACGRLIFTCALLSTPAWGAPPDDPACSAPAAGTEVVVERVIDGDTVLLAGGERVRIVGLDAPETGAHGRPDEPLAQAAAGHLRTLIGLAGDTVTRVDGEQAHDRYGRVLARLFTRRHGDLAAHLIENGLGFAVAIAPNTTGAACHFDAERRARDARRGLWRDPGQVTVRAADVAEAGFAIVHGEVTGVRQRRDDELLVLDDAFTVRVLPGGAGRDLRTLQGREVEVRGWVHPWRGGTRALTVSHPAMITVAPHMTYNPGSAHGRSR